MDPYFSYRDSGLYCEDVAVARLAEEFGTPLYIYSKSAIVAQLDGLHAAFAELDPLVCYSVKANSNLSVLKVVAERGGAFDVVSGGELRRVQVAGGNPRKTVFAGVGKTDEEIAAALEAGVLMFNVESEAELDAIARVASAMGRVAPCAPRVNPDVDPKTHRYISTGKKESKFGMHIERSLALAESAAKMPSVSLIGMHMHIGSQITTVEPYAGAASKGVEIIDAMRRLGHPVAWFNMGGGFGISYKGGEAKPVAEFARAIVPVVRESRCRLILEPGRVVVGNAGVLVSRVIFIKKSGEKTFVIQDAAMNDLIRPALYESFHRIWPVSPRAGATAPPDDFEAAIAGTTACDIVGPVCESGDFLAKDRALPSIERGDLLATFSAGAYGMVMASNYNTRPRAAEVLVDGSSAKLARRRETLDELLAPELVEL
ncbi:MAG: diaminopimelate decarboxylase [Planctomycetota bacterium]|nr:diaminopimelate decarboxylase [Planctomycetota bacterium]